MQILLVLIFVVFFNLLTSFETVYVDGLLDPISLFWRMQRPVYATRALECCVQRVSGFKGFSECVGGTSKRCMPPLSIHVVNPPKLTRLASKLDTRFKVGVSQGYCLLLEGPLPIS